MSTLFHPSRPVNRNRTFGQGVFVQRGPKLPFGPTLSDAQWAAENLNASADPSADEVADQFERLTLSALEYRTMRWEESAAKLARIVAAHDAEHAENGSQVGHDDRTEAVEAPTPWAFVKDASHRTDEAFAARYNAEKAARKAKEAAKARPVEPSFADELLDAILVDVPSRLTPADVARLERLGAPLDNGPAWTYSDEYLDACAAEVAAKDARKPKAITLHQKSRARRLALAKGGA